MSVDVSPDGRTLVFDLLGDIYSIPIEGGRARSLTSGPAWDSHPRFSPDGKTIAFTSDRGGIENVWLVDADGSNPRALTSEKDAYVRGAAWTPDGEYLIARKEDGKRAGIPPVELWMYHKDGGGGIKLTSSDDVNNASGPVASRDGRFLYYAAREARFNYIPNLSRGLGRSTATTAGPTDADVDERIWRRGETVAHPTTGRSFVSRRDNKFWRRVISPRDRANPAQRRHARRAGRVRADGRLAQLRVTPDGKQFVSAITAS
jgi:Tol biopolymer transport system component